MPKRKSRPHNFEADADAPIQAPTIQDLYETRQFDGEYPPIVVDASGKLMIRSQTNRFYVQQTNIN